MPPAPIPGAKHCPVPMEDRGMIPEALTISGWWAKPQRQIPAVLQGLQTLWNRPQNCSLSQAPR